MKRRIQKVLFSVTYLGLKSRREVVITNGKRLIAKKVIKSACDVQGNLQKSKLSSAPAAASTEGPLEMQQGISNDDFQESKADELFAILWHAILIRKQNLLMSHY